MNKTLNPLWDDCEETSFQPYSADDSWNSITFKQYDKNADFTCDGGKQYYATSNIEDEPDLFHQLLKVSWPNKTGRASFGFVVRKSDTGEVVAVIHQGYAWSWHFKLKYEPEGLKRHRHNENGWVTENLGINTINSVMYWLLQE